MVRVAEVQAGFKVTKMQHSGAESISQQDDSGILVDGNGLGCCVGYGQHDCQYRECEDELFFHAYVRLHDLFVLFLITPWTGRGAGL